MIEELKLILEGIAESIYGFVVLPGEVLLSALTVHLPGLARSMGIEGEAGTQSQLLFTSLGVWLLFAVICWLVYLLCKDFIRIGLAFFHTLVHRGTQGIGNLKTALICKLRERFPVRGTEPTSTVPTLELDDIDFAILRYVSDLGAGFTMSAPELADKFSLRPAQIQRSLDRLSHSRMLDSAIGSTDGFDNYRLTDAGAQFISMWQRRTANA